ncbi:Acetyltransferase (GNAT) family protein [Chitinophaga terrae (ex Kim and Jung 2007)]|uniref:Acetyltransferase (GNAT) family protein n=1 Tax=Chitinophaga terrae (ex Kim and Jung 2007) TaxID=408074 RepID=A0A1H4GF23_9BACT|nr:GNAT family N-acetyltransferase [Chitinophaga terrae (ex Kim and Jung 2007)]MDQ0110003.1 GNAT superfamily N-acetyltransferase [Chitinophaga terrae (ex Kim and Jung 2007)]GEP93385.1 N-acetyltransferase [Chitinophaga terrae (ex Kim and Jung 2007)]SEB07881.1 Acetyltransferase (GNAT) family protein [Chitinophaga terrae (ex Kim and Jung 2007)]
MEVIQATELHTNEVAVLFDAYRSYYDRDPDFKGALAFVTERITKKDSVIYVAMLKDEIIGFVQLFPIFTSLGMKKAWLLNDLYVLEEHRGIGAGKALLDAAYQLGKDTDAAWLMLQTYTSNKVAQSLYEKEGFVKDASSYYYYRKI